MIVANREWRRIWRFLLVGALNTLFGYVVFAAFVLATMPPQVALLLATAVGVLFNYHTVGRVVFRHAGYDRLLRFLASYAASYALNAALLALLTKLADINPLWAQLLCLPPTVLLTYVLMRNFVFQPHAPARGSRTFP